MQRIPFYVVFVFVLTTFLSFWVFYKASRNSKLTLLILSAWVILQSIVSISGFYTITNTIPPRFLFLGLPALLVIMGLFATQKGRTYIDRLDINLLTVLHTNRILVELVLFWLFTYKTVPQLMTFEGRNFDILAGISAPFILYFGLIKKKINKKIIITWNIICLCLLLNIIVNAALSLPFPFQQFAFDQPNIAVLYFPFVWLPCFIVPLALFSHLVVIRQLLRSDTKKNLI